MKKNLLCAVMLFAAGTLSFQSCIGSFNLTNSLLNWNKKLSNKFVNELVFIVISPAYAVCGLADVLVINSIEFWSGSNPLHVSAGKVKNVWGQDGRLYAVKGLKNGYEVTSPDGQKSYYLYDKKNDSWSVSANGKTQELFRMLPDGKVETVLPDGQTMDVSLDDAGMYQLRMAVNGGAYFAASK